MQVEQQPTLSDEELTYFARIGCGGDNVRWSFSEAGLRRTLASFAAAILSRASSAGTAPAPSKMLVEQMVDRFLGWKLPKTFAPDCYIAFDKERAVQSPGWPIGTNLFTADEARAMFEHALTIPEGIYYHPKSDHFYRRWNDKSQSGEFNDKWKNRRAEFPLGSAGGDFGEVGGAGTAPEPATGVTTAMMMEVAASMQPEAVSGHDPIVWTNADEKRLDDALAARNARRSPDPVVMLRFEFESMTAVEGWDRIYADYSKTFGRYPDAFMAQVVAQTKEDLFMWWGTHRDTIRAALVAFDNGVGAGAAPAGGVTTMQGLADYLRAMAYNQSAPDTLRQWASEVEAARAALSAQPEAGVESEFHKGARAMFDRLMFRAANHWHGNPKVNARCMGENKLIEEWAESALASLSGSSGEAPKAPRFADDWAPNPNEDQGEATAPEAK